MCVLAIHAVTTSQKAEGNALTCWSSAKDTIDLLTPRATSLAVQKDSRTKFQSLVADQDWGGQHQQVQRLGHRV